MHTCTGLTLALWSPTHAGHDFCFLVALSVEVLTGPCKEWSVLASARIFMTSRSAPIELMLGSPSDSAAWSRFARRGLAQPDGLRPSTGARRAPWMPSVPSVKLHVDAKIFSYDDRALHAVHPRGSDGCGALAGSHRQRSASTRGDCNVQSELLEGVLCTTARESSLRPPRICNEYLAFLCQGMI